MNSVYSRIDMSGQIFKLVWFYKKTKEYMNILRYKSIISFHIQPGLLMYELAYLLKHCSLGGFE